MNKWKVVTILSLSSVLMACSSAPKLESETDVNTPVIEEPATETPAIEAPIVEVPVVEVPAEEPDYSNLEQEDDLPEFEVDPKPEADKKPQPEESVTVALPTKSEDGKLLLGNKEWIYFPNSKRSFVAAVDEGLDISAVSVSDITPFERDGKKWVKFRINHDEIETEEFSLPVQRWLKNGTDSPKDPVVMGWIQIGDFKEKTEFVLSDKSKIGYPFVLGKSFYRDIAIVDESREFIQPKKK